MKKILLGFIPIGLLTLIGCKKEEEENNLLVDTYYEETNPLIGTWYSVQYEGEFLTFTKDMGFSIFWPTNEENLTNKTLQAGSYSYNNKRITMIFKKILVGDAKGDWVFSGMDINAIEPWITDYKLIGSDTLNIPVMYSFNDSIYTIWEGQYWIKN